MLPSVLSKNSIGSVLMNTASSKLRSGFDFQFRNIERTTITRLNAEIEDVVAKYSHEDELRRMQLEHDKLQDEIPQYQEYRFLNEGNSTRFQDIGDDISIALAIFDTGDGNLTAEQADQINETFANVIEGIEGLYPTSHPTLGNGNFVFQMRGLLEDIEGMEATAGVVDAEGTETPTNGNREFYDTLTDLLNRTNTASQVTSNTVSLTTDLIIDTQTKLFEMQAKQTEYQVADVKKVQFEVGQLKEKYAHLLQSISLSFEVNQGFSNYISESIQGNKVKPGSIMNLFA